MISRFQLYSTIYSIKFWYYFATVSMKSLQGVKHWGELIHSTTSTSTVVFFLHPSKVFLLVILCSHMHIHLRIYVKSQF